MRQAFTLLFILAVPLACGAQGDMLLVKKKGRVIKSYYQGSQIFFDAGSGVQQAQIAHLRNDSLFMLQYHTRRVMTTLGTYRWDTAGTYPINISYHDLQKIIVPGRGNAGSALMTAGGLLTVAGLANRAFTRKGKKPYATPAFITTSAALGAAGYLMSRSQAEKRYPIGRKYTLQYISTR